MPIANIRFDNDARHGWNIASRFSPGDPFPLTGKGKVVNVPLFIKEGELIKIDTRNGHYMGRS